MRTRALAPLLAVAALAAAPASNVAADEPPVVRAKTGKTVVRATLGSFCWRRDETSGVCGDAAYPLRTQGALPWKPRAPLVFGTSTPVDELEPCLSRVEDGRETQLNVCLAVERGADGKWRGQLPKNLRGANRLSIFVRRGTDDAHYSAALSR